MLPTRNAPLFEGDPEKQPIQYQYCIDLRDFYYRGGSDSPGAKDRQEKSRTPREMRMDSKKNETI